MDRYGRWIDDYAAGRLRGRRARAIARHVGHCAECSSALARRMSETSSEQLVAPAPPVQLSAQTLLGTRYSLPPENESSRRHSIAIVPITVLAMVFALVAAMAATSWVLGAPAAHGAPEQDPAASWSAEAQSLDAEAITRLRQDGWTCPVIEAAGFSLASASGVLKRGEATATLVLSDGKHRIELAETRMVSGAPTPAMHKSVAAETSTDPSSGMLTELGHRLGAKAAAAVSYGDGTATLNLEEVKYEITTDLSKSDVEGILQRLVVSEHTRVGSMDQQSTENVSQRLLRGFSRLMVLDFK